MSSKQLSLGPETSRRRWIFRDHYCSSPSPLNSPCQASSDEPGHLHLPNSIVSFPVQELPSLRRNMSRPSPLATVQPPAGIGLGTSFLGSCHHLPDIPIQAVVSKLFKSDPTTIGAAVTLYGSLYYRNFPDRAAAGIAKWIEEKIKVRKRKLGRPTKQAHRRTRPKSPTRGPRRTMMRRSRVCRVIRKRKIHRLVKRKKA